MQETWLREGCFPVANGLPRPTEHCTVLVQCIVQYKASHALRPQHKFVLPGNLPKTVLPNLHAQSFKPCQRSSDILCMLRLTSPRLDGGASRPLLGVVPPAHTIF